MGKRLWCGLLGTVLCAGAPEAQEIADDQVRLLRPGLTVSVFEQRFSTGSLDGGSFWSEAEKIASIPCCGVSGAGNGTDAAGGFYRIAFKRIPIADEPFCDNGSGRNETDVYDIERLTPGGAEVVARIPTCVAFNQSCESICAPGNFFNFVVGQSTIVLNLAVDGIGGHLYLAVLSERRVNDSSGCLPCSATISEQVTLRISGLPSVLEIIPTFQPASGTLGWVAPKHPEALPAADRFLVYTGDIASLHADRDFTRAVPVDCAVPDVGAPTPGDFLSILDPLPDPLPGQGSYAIIGVDYAGQRRFGRQNLGGVLSGRDPLSFGGCV